MGWVFSIFPFEQINQVVAPPSGWLDTLKRAAGFTVAGVEPQVSMVTPALLVSLAGLLVLGLVKAVRCRHPLDPIFVLMAIIAFSSNWLVLLFPKDLLRTVAIPLALLPFVIGGSQRVTTAAREPEPESPPAAQGAESEEVLREARGAPGPKPRREPLSLIGPLGVGRPDCSRTGPAFRRG